jgi:hypothetical protein
MRLMRPSIIYRIIELLHEKIYFIKANMLILLFLSWLLDAVIIETI